MTTRWTVLGILLVGISVLTSCAPRELICLKRGGDTWYEVRSDNFILRTNVDRDDAKTRSRQLERMYDALAEVISLVLPHSSAPADPIEIVHFSHPMQLEEFVGESTGGFMSKDKGTVFIASSEGHTGKGRDHLLMHELTHRFLAAQVHSYPRWLTEGLAGFYETLIVDGGEVVVGGLPQGYSQLWFGNTGFLPSLTELREMDAQTFYGKKYKHGNYFAAWRLVHFLTNTTGERYQRFRHYVSQLVEGVPEADAWRLSFGGAGDLSGAVRNYRGKRMVGKRKVEYMSSEIPEPEVRKLRDGEVHVLWARMSNFRRFAKGKLGKKNSKRRHVELDAARNHDPEYADVAFWQVDLADASERPAKRDALWEYVRSTEAPPRALLSLLHLEFDTYGSAGTASARQAVLKGLEPIVNQLEADAKSGHALNTLAWYYALTENPAKGLPLASRSVRRSPSCANCLDTYALLLYQAGRPQLALRVQERAIALYGESGGVPKSAMDRLRLYSSVL